MLRKLGLSFLLSICLGIAAKAQLGGLGSDIGSGGAGGDVSDVSGGAGTTGGNQGTQVPIDKEIVILFAVGVALLGKKLYDKNKSKASLPI